MVAELETLRAEALARPADVADARAVFAAAERDRSRAWPDRHLCAQRHSHFLRAVADMTTKEFRRVTEVTYLGYVHHAGSAMLHATAQLRRRRAGGLCACLSQHPAPGRYCGASRPYAAARIRCAPSFAMMAAASGELLHTARVRRSAPARLGTTSSRTCNPQVTTGLESPAEIASKRRGQKSKKRRETRRLRASQP
jgi:hypothetical protein